MTTNFSQETAELVEILARKLRDTRSKVEIARQRSQTSQEKNAETLTASDLGVVPDENLSEVETQHDREMAQEIVEDLLAKGYQIQWSITSSSSAEKLSTAAAKQRTDHLQRKRDASQADLSSLQKLWYEHDSETWSADPKSYRLFCDRILKLGEPLIAYDVAAEGIRFFPKDVRLRQLLALALARSGAAGSANKILEGLYRERHRNEETLGLLGRTHKDLAVEAIDSSEALQHLRKACRFYEQAYKATGGYWSGINAATLALLLGERGRAVALAREVGDRCREQLNGRKSLGGNRYWLLSTLGEAALILGQWQEAEEWYGKATELARGDWGSLQSIRRNARLLMQHMDGDADRLEGIFRFPSVVVFTGHMIDAPDRVIKRFPPELEHPVKKELRQRLKELEAGFGYASAACGSDILFHEIMLEMKAETHVILPYERAFFAKSSVDIVDGADWAQRYERVIAQAVEVQEASHQRKQGSDLSYEFTNLLLYGLASVRAQQLETRLVPLAVWDGQAGRPGGTAAAVEQWRKLGRDVQILDLGKILRSEDAQSPQQATVTAAASSQASDGAPELISEIRALLFADVEGFSTLSDEEIPRFVQHFLGLVGKLASESEYKPLTKNTWGDGLYFVFSDVRAAGQFALGLRDAVSNFDWSTTGLPTLSLRIGLHAGPVYSCNDPVTNLPTYIGAHVSRAARIEPVTPTGQVYASQTFAALAAAENVKELHCDYVGMTSLAKKYGTFPTYVVLRRRTAEQSERLQRL